VKEGILGFALGCFVVGVVIGFYALGLKAELRNARTEAQNQMMYASTCQAKFTRFTVLYTQRKNILGGVYGNVLKGWAIPADVTPVYVGTDFGMFSHYDPKTQVETVKFPAKK
jgi:hypothetical protein